MKYKRGLSQVITIVIFVALALVLIGIVWTVVNNLIQNSVEDIEINQKGLEINIKPIKSSCNNNFCNITVKRDSKGEDIAGLKIVFISENKEDSITKSYDENIPALATKTIRNLDVSSIEDIGLIEISPYFKDSKGEEVIIEKKESIKPFITSSSSEEDSSFECGTSTIEDINGNTYGTVLINGQCWMDSNMRTTKYPDGSDIEKGPSNHGASGWESDNGYYSCPPNATNNGEDCSNLEKFGLLYQWSAVMHDSTTEGSQGLCPDEWHVPSDSEWYALESFLADPNFDCAPDRINSIYAVYNNCSYVGDSLAGYKEDWYYNGQIGKYSTFNTTGFQAPPTGYRHANGNYYWRTFRTRFWTSTKDSTSVFIRDIYNGVRGFGRYTFGTMHGNPVRCIKDSL